MQTSTAARLAGAALTLALLVGGNVAFARTAQNISITVAGSVMDLGDQHYDMHGGNIVMASVSGNPVNPASKLDYRLTADVKGLGVKGSASFEMTGTTADNQNLKVKGDVQITDMVAQTFPLGCSGNSCNSALPIFFVGTASLQVTIGTSQVSKQVSTILIESPYLNPWGNPISMTTTDGNLILVAGYDAATIDWHATQVGGVVSGVVGSDLTPVSGTFSMTSHEREDLVKGIARDDGQLSFSQMSPSYLNVKGMEGPGQGYSGNSLIPTAGESDCTDFLASMSLPAFPGTCTTTGFQSDGTFKAHDHGTSITGTYSTTWTAPAYAFSSSITATSTQN